MGKHVCPWWLAYTFDNPLRFLIHKPEKIFAPYLQKGMTVADIGCGMGHFTIGMARIVGDDGRIIAVDVQQKMLDIMMKRARKVGVADRISPRLSDGSDIGIRDEVDFVLAFWMAHETPDILHFLKQVRGILKKSGRLLLAEPKIHVTFKEFKATLGKAAAAGLKITGRPKISLSHAALLEKK